LWKQGTRNKSQREHILPISPLMRQCIDALMRAADGVTADRAVPVPARVSQHRRRASAHRCTDASVAKSGARRPDEIVQAQKAEFDLSLGLWKQGTRNKSQREPFDRGNCGSRGAGTSQGESASAARISASMH
jgi:hypothetical protein